MLDQKSSLDRTKLMVVVEASSSSTSIFGGGGRHRRHYAAIFGIGGNNNNIKKEEQQQGEQQQQQQAGQQLRQRPPPPPPPRYPPPPPPPPPGTTMHAANVARRYPPLMTIPPPPPVVPLIPPPVPPFSLQDNINNDWDVSSFVDQHASSLLNDDDDDDVLVDNKMEKETIKSRSSGRAVQTNDSKTETTATTTRRVEEETNSSSNNMKDEEDVKATAAAETDENKNKPSSSSSSLPKPPPPPPPQQQQQPQQPPPPQQQQQQQSMFPPPPLPFQGQEQQWSNNPQDPGAWMAPPQWNQQQQQQQQQQQTAPWSDDNTNNMNDNNAMAIWEIQRDLEESLQREYELLCQVQNLTTTLSCMQQREDLHTQQLDIMTERVVQVETKSAFQHNKILEYQANCTAFHRELAMVRGQVAEWQARCENVTQHLQQQVEFKLKLQAKLEQKIIEAEDLATMIEQNRMETAQSVYTQRLLERRRSSQNGGGFLSWLFGWSSDVEDDEDEWAEMQEAARSTLLEALQNEREAVEELEAGITTLQQNNSAISEQVASRDVIIQQLNERIAVFEEDKVVLKAALRQLQKEMSEEAPKTQKLVQDLQASRDKVQQLQKEIQKIMAEHEKQVKSLEVDIRQKEKMIIQSESNLTVIGTYVDRLEERLADFAMARRELDARQREFNETRQQLDEVVQERNDLKKRIDELQSEHDELRTLLQEMATERATKERELHKLRNEKQSLIQQDDNLKESVQSLTSRLNALETTHNETMIKIQDYEDQIVQLTRSNEHLKRRLENTDGVAADLRVKVDDMILNQREAEALLIKAHAARDDLQRQLQQALVEAEKYRQERVNIDHMILGQQEAETMLLQAQAERAHLQEQLKEALTMAAKYQLQQQQQEALAARQKADSATTTEASGIVAPALEQNETTTTTPTIAGIVSGASTDPPPPPTRPPPRPPVSQDATATATTPKEDLPCEGKTTEGAKNVALAVTATAKLSSNSTGSEERNDAKSQQPLVNEAATVVEKNETSVMQNNNKTSVVANETLSLSPPKNATASSPGMETRPTMLVAEAPSGGSDKNITIVSESPQLIADKSPPPPPPKNVASSTSGESSPLPPRVQPAVQPLLAKAEASKTKPPAEVIKTGNVPKPGPPGSLPPRQPAPLGQTASQKPDAKAGQPEVEAKASEDAKSAMLPKTNATRPLGLSKSASAANLMRLIRRPAPTPKGSSPFRPVRKYFAKTTGMHGFFSKKPHEQSSQARPPAGGVNATRLSRLQRPFGVDRRRPLPLPLQPGRQALNVTSANKTNVARPTIPNTMINAPARVPSMTLTQSISAGQKDTNLTMQNRQTPQPRIGNNNGRPDPSTSSSTTASVLPPKDNTKK